MTIFYVDPLGGDDTKDGKSFANRVKLVKTLTGPFTAGDEIRYIADPDPVSIGNFTFTNGSLQVIPATPLDIVEICSGTSAFTGIAGTGVTQAQAPNAGVLGPTTAKLSTSSSTPANTKIAYYTLPAALDLSEYDQLSYVTLAYRSLTSYDLCLCSDDTGDVILQRYRASDGMGNATETGDTSYADSDSVTDSSLAYPIQFMPRALPAGVKSVAIYTRSTTVSAGALSISNLIASKSATQIAHGMLISRQTEDEPEWLCVNAIEKNAITIGTQRCTFADRALAYKMRPYFGVEGVGPLYAKICRPMAATTAARTTSSSVAMSYTGGWDRTSMSAQTGMTSLRSGIGTSNYFLGGSSTKTCINVNKLQFVTGSGVMIPPVIGKLSDVDLINYSGSNPSYGINSFSSNSSLTEPIAEFNHIVQCYVPTIGPQSSGDRVHYRIKSVRDCVGTSSTSTVLTLGNTSYPAGTLPVSYSRFRIDKISNLLGPIGIAAGVALYGPTRFINQSAAQEYFRARSNTGVVTIQGIPDATIGADGDGFISSENALANQYYRMDMQTAESHDGKPAPAITIKTATYHSVRNNPVQINLAQIYVPAGKTLTVKCWDKLLVGTAGVISSRIAFLVYAADNVVPIGDFAFTAASWTERTISIVASRDGIIEVFGQMAGTVNSKVVFSDLTYTIT